ncbi:MAG: heme lyase CcmF/NrfE family subunit [Acidobacteria bacterium]|nr:heme lyase CcmF/NrfE family subunit [Acidobacteriota bacterium]MBV9146107.1 heme lyase CcmF/NrfE family subunit [Acidobacteriota bacterium]MBV9437214.1 heme lyase CcmF/NrfE family subunit [Acidobacteriota bacterium]
MPAFGSFALILALALSAYCFLAGSFALRQQAVGIPSDRLAETARRAGIATWIAVAAAAFALVWAALNNDFSVAYILHHTNRDLPTPYKFAALWSGQEGSLLFWALLLSSYGLVLRLRHKVDVKLTAYASTILAAVQIFFLLLLNFAATPFSMVRGAVPPDGNGLNPLLQYPEMVIHPPMLYLGYVGFAVPFAFALGALIMKYPGEKWIHITRRWTMVTWCFLTCGIFLGAHWAYSVLGWGGYWGWDPVENASVFPWLTGTAFLHSVMMQEKRGMLKTWNVWLIFCTFMLSILGTFLTRSGVVSSVHAFAQSSIGEWFIWFLGITLVVCCFFYIRNRDHLKSEHRLESLLSRESSFLFQNLVLLAACFALLWGTLFPVLSEWVQGHKITVGPPFFNRVNIPIAMFLLLLTGVGPLLAWRSTSWASLKRNFTIPVIAAVATAILLMVFGVRPWEDAAHFYSLMAISLCALVTATIVSEFVRGGRVISRHTGQNLLASMVTLTRRNTRRYGGYIVHFGIVVIVVGLAGAAFNQQKEQELGSGERMELGAYTVVCDSYSQDDTANYEMNYAVLNVFKNGNPLGQMFPARKFFKASQQPDTIVAIRSTPLEDLYIIYAGLNQDSNKPIIKVFINPLVSWIWAGVFVLIFGTVVAMIPPMAAAAVPQLQTVRAVSMPVPVRSDPVGAGD